MKTGYKYFIEHKELHTWLTYNGELTNDPNNKGLLTFDEDWIAEKYLKPLEPDISSDFSGQHIHYDYTGVTMWNMLREETLEKSKSDLYKDFIITEHEFVLAVVPK